MLKKVFYAHAQLLHVFLNDTPIFDDDDRLAAHQTVKAAAFEHKNRNEHLERNEHQNGDEPAEKRLTAVLHRDHRKVRDEQRHDQFTRLQLVDLPFAHNANSQNNRKIQNDCAHKRNKHGVFLSVCLRRYYASSGV